MGWKVIHHVELSLFPNWCGTDQERFIELDGERLTITTAPVQVGGTTFSRYRYSTSTTMLGRTHSGGVSGSSRK